MIVGLFTGLESIGGVQLAGCQTAAALASLANAQGLPFAFLSLNDRSGEHEFSVSHTGVQFRGFERRKLRFVQAALLLAHRKPKLIFAAHPNLASIAWAMKVVAGNAPVIVGAHGIEVWRPLPPLQRKALRHADLLIAPSSDSVAKLARVQRISENKIRKLPWPLDPGFLKLVNTPEKLPLPSSFPAGEVVLSVGRWSVAEKYKGSEILIGAVARLSSRFPGIQLVFVGPGDDIPRLKNEAQSGQVADRVHFLANVSREELAACYSHAKIFALPSTGEGFGLVFLEAMAFGKPVIGTPFGGIPDVVTHGREGLLVEPKVDAVSNALARLLSDPALCAELGEHARQRVAAEFSFEQFRHRLHLLIGELIQDARTAVNLAAQ